MLPTEIAGAPITEELPAGPGSTGVYLGVHGANPVVFKTHQQLPAENVKDYAQATSPKKHPSISHRALVLPMGAGHIRDLGSWVVYPKAEGAPLTQASGGLTPGESTELLIELIKAVKTLHDHGVFHHNIAPHQVFVTDQKKPLLLDVGWYWNTEGIRPNTGAADLEGLKSVAGALGLTPLVGEAASKSYPTISALLSAVEKAQSRDATFSPEPATGPLGGAAIGIGPAPVTPVPAPVAGVPGPAGGVPETGLPAPVSVGLPGAIPAPVVAEPEPVPVEVPEPAPVAEPETPTTPAPVPEPIPSEPTVVEPPAPAEDEAPASLPPSPEPVPVAVEPEAAEEVAAEAPGTVPVPVLPSTPALEEESPVAEGPDETVTPESEAQQEEQEPEAPEPVEALAEQAPASEAEPAEPSEEQGTQTEPASTVSEEPAPEPTPEAPAPAPAVPVASAEANPGVSFTPLADFTPIPGPVVELPAPAPAEETPEPSSAAPSPGLVAADSAPVPVAEVAPEQVGEQQNREVLPDVAVSATDLPAGGVIEPPQVEEAPVVERVEQALVAPAPVSPVPVSPVSVEAQEPVIKTSAPEVPSAQPAVAQPASTEPAAPAPVVAAPAPAVPAPAPQAEDTRKKRQAIRFKKNPKGTTKATATPATEEGQQKKGLVFGRRDLLIFGALGVGAIFAGPPAYRALSEGLQKVDALTDKVTTAGVETKNSVEGYSTMPLYSIPLTATAMVFAAEAAIVVQDGPTMELYSVVDGTRIRSIDLPASIESIYETTIGQDPAIFWRAGSKVMAYTKAMGAEGSLVSFDLEAAGEQVKLVDAGTRPMVLDGAKVLEVTTGGRGEYKLVNNGSTPIAIDAEGLISGTIEGLVTLSNQQGTISRSLELAAPEEGMMLHQWVFAGHGITATIWSSDPASTDEKTPVKLVLHRLKDGEVATSIDMTLEATKGLEWVLGQGGKEATCGRLILDVARAQLVSELPYGWKTTRIKGNHVIAQDETGVRQVFTGSNPGFIYSYQILAQTSHGLMIQKGNSVVCLPPALA